MSEIRLGEQSPIGQRVAVVSANMETFLGYGEYLGDFHNPVLVEEWARLAEKHEALSVEDRAAVAAKIRAREMRFGLNPKIRLDDGREVWGYQCWWGPAEDFKANGYAKKYGVES